MLSPRKVSHAAIFLPILGIFLLMPPVVFLFMKPVSLFGIPLLVAYIFLVWLGLILLARYMGPRLTDDIGSEILELTGIDEQGP